MATERQKQMRERHLKENKKYKIIVENRESDGKLSFIATTEYSSILEALHKIELDLMTNLHFNLENPIKISIVEI